MIIKSVEIEKFRGFQNVHFDLGKNITIIAGQNGTQKTTLLGLMTQPFTITEIPEFKDERPLCGGSYRSSFIEKFRLSKKFDKAGEHLWKLNFYNKSDLPFELESINRDKRKGLIRFWQKGNREQGSGYMQYPVIYLSLGRLFPLGEIKNIKASINHSLTDEELRFFNKWHKNILISADESIQNEMLLSPSKVSMGINTDNYDWESNSAGQDDISKILLAVLSFRRLKKKYPKVYKGGILAIDELDASIYPGSQIKLFDFLNKFSQELGFQLIFTTHSLTILEIACEYQEKNKSSSKDINILYLRKIDGLIDISEGLPFLRIKNFLKVSIDPEATPDRINIFTEDDEARIFINTLIPAKWRSHFTIDKSNIGGKQLIDLAKRKIISFTFPNALIIVDGDTDVKSLPNALALPGGNSPERVLALFLNEKMDADPIWAKIHSDYTKQMCFSSHDINDIIRDRDIAKNWFRENCKQPKWKEKIIHAWMLENAPDVENFKSHYKVIYNKFAAKIGFDKLI
ncbi:AAA family ATPase [Rhizosphaericola mali]|uniref:ATP-binding protein n=1 Tax=Rhizosphaericola mali TaxID=2545455 RepID=A0A5P2G3F4_9BACT|nr:AAA family ATPase [Rhizosphaericola mali]QES87623.1 ATP-binding protein [Rhizosphaericola mali]